jgi:hypothetical protein
LLIFDVKVSRKPKPSASRPELSIFSLAEIDSENLARREGWQFRIWSRKKETLQSVERGGMSGNAGI